jgi:hypothetical protein
MLRSRQVGILVAILFGMRLPGVVSRLLCITHVSIVLCKSIPSVDEVIDAMDLIVVWRANGLAESSSSGCII